jgi:hypothetical protein
MLSYFFSHWNPLNIYGDKAEIEDIIRKPLEADETLMEDSSGCCHRIRTLSSHSNVWKKIMFWFQTHLNQNDFSIAVDHLLAQLHRILLEDPPTLTQRLTEFYMKLEKLESLKNISSESHRIEGEIVQIEVELLLLRRLAYLIFAYSHHEHVKKKELSRKERFFLFREIVNQNLSLLAQEYSRCLILDRLLIVVTEDNLYPFFYERCVSFKHRLELLNETYSQINEIENLHLGKFTVIHFKRILRHLRSRLGNELRKLAVEARLMIEHLVVNFQIYPRNHAVASLLTFLMESSNKKEEENHPKDLFNEEYNRLTLFIDHCLHSR